MKNIHFFEQNLTRILCVEDQLNTLNLKNKYGRFSSRHSIYNFSFLLHLVLLEDQTKKETETNPPHIAFCSSDLSGESKI